MNAGKSRAITYCPRSVVIAQAPAKRFNAHQHPRIADHGKFHTPTIGGMDYKKLSGRRIKELREAKGWSLQDLSTKTKDVLSRTRIGNYETGERMVGPREAVILAQALGTRAPYIMAIDDVQIPISPQEEVLIRNWRKLPESERMHYWRQIEQLAVTWSDSHASDAVVEAHLPALPQSDRLTKAVAHKKVKAR